MRKGGGGGEREGVEMSFTCNSLFIANRIVMLDKRERRTRTDGKRDRKYGKR